MDGGRFSTTRWTLIMAAGGKSAESRAALNELCRIYWPPLYTFVRYDRPRTPADAADLTQAFFASVLAREDIAGLDRERGRFRGWLLQSMRNFLANQHDHAATAAAGGAMIHVSLDDAMKEEARLQAGPASAAPPPDPEKAYLRRWALCAVERALATFREELAQRDPHKARMLDALSDVLWGERSEGGYAPLAARLGTTEGNLRILVFRWREHLRAQVADTLAAGADVDAEIAELIGVLE